MRRRNLGFVVKVECCETISVVVKASANARAA